MADIGRLVTNAEVLANVKGIKVLDTLEASILKGAEAAIENWCHNIFSELEHEDEVITIRTKELRSGGQAVQSKVDFYLPQIPVKTFTSLKIVTGRSSTDGSVSSSEEIGKDLYYVDLRTGLVSLLSALTISSIEPASLTSWPSGVGQLLANWTGGYAIANVPADLKLAVYHIMARLWKIQDKAAFHIEEVQSEVGTTRYVRTNLTKEEKLLLGPYRHWGRVMA